MGEKRYVPGQFGQIHVEIFGQGPSILMHHQAPADRRGFQRAAPLVAAAGFRVILVDMPGYGMSDAPPEPPSVEGLADTIRAVATALCDGPVVVLGHHTGSMMASEAVVQFPDLLRAVILYAPLIFTDEEVTAWRSGVVERERSFHLQADGGHYLDVWRYITGFVPGNQNLESLHWLALSALSSGARYWYAHNACINYDSAKSLQAVNESGLPAVIISNSGDACAAMVERAVALCDQIPHVALKGGSIDFANEQPEVWAEAVVSFLKGLPDA